MSTNEWDDWEEEEDSPTLSLFGTELHPSAAAALQDAITTQNFDCVKVIKELGLDFHTSMRFINYLRLEVKEKRLSSAKDLPDLKDRTLPFYHDDALLKPVVDGDPLLFSVFDDDDDDEVNCEDNGAGPCANNDDDELTRLRRELAVAQQAAARCDVLESKLQQALDVGRRTLQLDTDPKAATTADKPARRSKKKPDADSDDDSDSDSDSDDEDGSAYYFDSYTRYNIHEEMLKDVTRTEAYRDSMYENRAAFKDKVVLDIGCGTGILCMFAARAGAKKVIGIDRAGIVEKTKEIVLSNNLQDIVTIVSGQVEHILELPDGVEKVDIIVSEWMGYALFYENMLQTVLTARDRWLAPGGNVYPDKATVFIAGVGDGARYIEEKVDFWNDVYGFKMTEVRSGVYKEAHVQYVPSEGIITEPFALYNIDINTMEEKDLDFVCDFRLTADARAVSVEGGARQFTALCLWFDVDFVSGLEKHINLPTGPFTTSTHWKQTAFLLEHALPVDDGTVVCGSLSCKRNNLNPREMDFVVKYGVEGKGEQFTQAFEMR